MKRVRRPTEEDLKLFRQHVTGTKPLRFNRVHHEPPPPLPIPRQRWRDEHETLHESLHAPLPVELLLEGGEEAAFARAGVSHNTLKDLRRGRWTIQAELDLHGANRVEARELVAQFLVECLHSQLRCVRIIHGKGLRSPGREPVLKTLVQAWLARRDEVLAYCQTRAADGGSGALLVLLRGPTRQRQPAHRTTDRNP